MSALIENHCFRLLERGPRINFDNHFDLDMDDATARIRYNFTIGELQCLSIKLRLPQLLLLTSAGDSPQR